MNTNTNTPADQIAQPVYGSPEYIVASITEWIGKNGGENATSMLLWEAMSCVKRLAAASAVVAPAAPTVVPVEMGHGNVAVGTCKRATDGVPGIIYLQIPGAAREHATDCGDLYPVGSAAPADQMLACIHFATAETVQQSINVLRELQAEHYPAAPQDERAAAQFFAYDPGCGLDTYPTAEEAQKAALESIEEYRDHADDEWPSDVEQVCWGVVLGEASATPMVMDTIDYVLRDLAALPAQAVDPAPITMKEICPGCGTQFECFHNGYINELRAQAIATVADEPVAVVSATGPDDEITAVLLREVPRGTRLYAHAAPVQEVAPTDARNELVTLLRAIRPEYGAVGSRDIEVTAQQSRIDRAIELLAPTAPQAVPDAQPLFWYRPRSDEGYEGPIHNDRIERVRKESGGWVPLFPSAQPAAQPADAQDVSRLIGHSAYLSVALREDDKDAAVESWRSLPQHLQDAITFQEEIIEEDRAEDDAS